MSAKSSNKMHITSLRILFTSALLIIAAHWSPYVIMGDNAYITIHDYLDSSFLKAKVLADSGQVFAPSSNIIAQYDIPRGAMRSEFQIPTLLNMFLLPLTAHVALTLAMQLVAFLGMYVLLVRHIIGGENPVVCVGVALCYALLPFWTPGVLGVAGLPLALYAFLGLREGEKHWVLWAILALFPFFSSLITVGFFFLCLVASIFLSDLLMRRRFNLAFFCGMALMSIMYIAVEYRLFLNAIQSVFTSHRQEASPIFFSLAEGLSRAWDNFRHGQYHAHSLQNEVVLPTITLALLLTVWKRNFKDKQLWLLVCTLLLCAAISLFYGLWSSVILEPLRNSVPLMMKFNFSRFHWLHPLLWFLAFALSLVLIQRQIPYRRLGLGIVCLALALQAHWAGYKNHPIVRAEEKHGISYAAFFATPLFSEIKREIGRPLEDYRVVSLGMHPAIAAYNGFYTADWYLTYYPLEKKHAMRRVIARELDKDPRLKRYFDDWGNRLYLFSAELGRDFVGDKSSGPIRMPDYDIEELRALGVRFIFSRVELQDAPPLLGAYEHPDSHWNIHVYQLVDTTAKQTPSPPD